MTNMYRILPFNPNNLKIIKLCFKATSIEEKIHTTIRIHFKEATIKIDAPFTAQVLLQVNVYNGYNQVPDVTPVGCWAYT
jgi:hypothetical protein